MNIELIYFLKKIHEWSTENKLQINVNKSNAVLYRPKSKHIACTMNLTYQDKNIEALRNIKILGITFSQNMLWDNHIDSVAIKLSRILGMTRRHRAILPYNVKMIIYNSLFYSHLTYCSLVWGTSTYTNLQKLCLAEKVCPNPF